ncbi:DoxX family protein [Methyloceanibacter stevinii]|uniref:DoxX family protein n=1 Tax=Methyloceanibacter stevinii TaxID=1774970 RepID=A0A1E3VTQ0_9HYPH|nr:DoxX family protein [Methyloceanibacter stevinii]ODR96904.1 DoxX family protein [Methyloceanibacter stevinii]
MSALVRLLKSGRNLAEGIPYSLVALIARLSVASVFWRSGLTKVDEYFQLRSTTFFLFKEEYKVPVIPPEVLAYLATYQELIGAVLLAIGLATRLTALAFIGMVAVIQVFVYPQGWPDHILWFALLFLLVARGPGAISVDHLIWRRVT